MSPTQNLNFIQEYWVDAWQRSILFLDVLRQRGNIYLRAQRQECAERARASPFELVRDGRTLPRPVNYVLVRIVPPAGTADRSGQAAVRRRRSARRPWARHRRHEAGQRDRRRAGGRPSLLLHRLPARARCRARRSRTCARAEAAFVEEVAARHPEAEGKPVDHRQLPGRLADHDDGRDPARPARARSCWPARRSPTGRACAARTRCAISAALLGGTWLTALAGDLGNGIFDGANLVANFESLNPANTYWEKPYNVYSKVDTEAERFLDFETWWGSPVLLNAGEMQWIADNLFVGNKLTAGEIRTSDGVRVDLRNIKSPIIVFCSWGDNITPPQQALGWITDLYDHDDEIVANGQTIVYTLHQTIGHLGIFVSGKVATKEHAEFASCMEMIDLMPPGLYEAVITEVDEDTANRRPDPRQVSVPAGGAHARRHPRARRQRRRGRPALRRRRARCPRSITASTARSPSRRCGR